MPSRAHSAPFLRSILLVNQQPYCLALGRPLTETSDVLKRKPIRRRRWRDGGSKVVGGDSKEVGKLIGTRLQRGLLEKNQGTVRS